MAFPNTEIQAVSIVLVGEFNPKIFQPAWFVQENLLRKLEADNAVVEIIHPEINIFNLDWLRLEVTRGRFKASSLQEPFWEVLRDLVLGTFRLLRHTPIRALEINKEVHIKMNSTEEWHALGDWLTPKGPWNNILEKPGMSSLVMEGVRPDGYFGKIRTHVAPSSRVSPSVFMNVNDPYQLKEKSPPESIGCEETTKLLESSWKESQKRADNIISTLMNTRPR